MVLVCEYKKNDKNKKLLCGEHSENKMFESPAP